MPIPIELIPHPPFNPIHGGLYGPFELLQDFDPSNAISVIETLDYKSYIYFQQQGRTTISDPYAAMMEALHDASIVRGMNAFLETGGTGRPASGSDNGRPPGTARQHDLSRGCTDRPASL